MNRPINWIKTKKINIVIKTKTTENYRPNYRLYYTSDYGLYYSPAVRSGSSSILF